MQDIIIKINPEYEKLFKRYFDQDTYNSIKNSIQMHGQLNSIIVNSEGIILDGHTRYQICQELGVNVKYEIRDYPDKLLEKLYVYNCNLRRNLNDFCRVEIALEKRPLLTEVAKDISLSNLKQGNNIPNVTNVTLGRVDEQIGKESGVSYRLVWKIRKIINLASEDLITKLRKGDIHIDRAFQQLNRAEDHKLENIPELPQGDYDVILADPPWQYDVTLRGSPENHYETMDIEDIKQLPVPAAENAILFLWTTTAMLKKSLDVMDSWNFEYKTHMVWIKNKIGLGYFVRGKHELLMIGVKGKMPLPETDDRPESVLIADVREHSKKPDEVYDIIEKMYPNRTYLELFARCQHNDNWSVWGMEAPQINK